MEDPVYTGMGNFKLSTIGKDQSMISLRLNYFNPGKSKARLKKAEGDAWIDGTYLGHFTTDSMIKIAAKTPFSVPVSLKVDMKNAVKNFAAAILNPDVTLKIDGKAKIGRNGFFIHYPIHYEGKQNISFLK